ncbi:MAG: hypothetical protein ACKORM_03820, partial [Solirubrobacterales bacterium]
MAPSRDNRRVLLVGGGLVALATVVTVVAALSGAARDEGAEAGERLLKPRLLWTSLDCPPGAPAVEARVVPGKARRILVQASLVREGRKIAGGRVGARASGGRVTVRIPFSPASDLLLPYCRLVEGTSLTLALESRRGRDRKRLVRTIEGDRYRAEPSRRIPLGSVGEPVSEASGLVESRSNPGTFYTHDDSGGEAAVYILADDGTVVATQPVAGVVNRDWEDIALGPDRAGRSIYIGEIGDNGGSRASISVYRIPEPDLEGLVPGGSLPPVIPEIVDLVYPDGARDAEAMLVDPSNGDIYVITKREARSRVYRAPAPRFQGETVTLERVGDLAIGGVVGADVCPDGQTVLVKTYPEVLAYVSDSGVEAALTGEPAQRLYEPQISFFQDETVAADPWCTGYSVLPEGSGAPLAR